MKFSGFLVRWLVALLLVAITFNPTGYSLFHWITPFENIQVPLKILALLVVLTVYIVYLTATFRSLGLLGIFLLMSLCGVLIWLFADQGWLDIKNATTTSWLMIFIIGTIMGLGISWSHIKKRLTGQFDTDDVGE